MNHGAFNILLRRDSHRNSRQIRLTPFQPLANCSCNATTDNTNSHAQFLATAASNGCYVQPQRFQASLPRLCILRSLPGWQEAGSLADSQVVMEMISEIREAASLGEARAFCRRLARSHYENFFVASI